jgi:hypothetical protein
MSYAIPTNELSLADRKAFINAAVEAGVKRAIDLGVARNRLELVVREAHPGTDFSAPGAVGWTNEYYLTQGAAANLVWALVFDTGLPCQLQRNQIAVFYKIADANGNPVTTAVRFRVGQTGATTKASFFIQQFIDIKLEPEVYLSEPVVYNPEDWLFIEHYGRAATPAGGEELSFCCFIVERTGGTVS